MFGQGYGGYKGDDGGGGISGGGSGGGSGGWGGIVSGVLGTAMSLVQLNAQKKWTDPNRPKARRLTAFTQILRDYQDQERLRFDRGQALLSQLANANLNLAAM